MNGLQHFWGPPGETREPQHGIADPTPQFHSKGLNAPPLGCQRVGFNAPPPCCTRRLRTAAAPAASVASAPAPAPPPLLLYLSFVLGVGARGGPIPNLSTQGVRFSAFVGTLGHPGMLSASLQ